MPPRSRTPGRRTAASSTSVAATVVKVTTHFDDYVPTPKARGDVAALRAEFCTYPSDAWGRFKAWVAVQYWRYMTLTCLIYMSWWEAILMTSVHFLIFGLVGFAVYTQVTKGAELLGTLGFGLSSVPGLRSLLAAGTAG